MASPHYKCFQTLLRSSHVIGIWNYIEGIRFTVSDLAKRVIKTQENVITIEHTMKTWKSEPLFVRIDDGKSEPLFNIKGDV